uniref:Uncharacterized protein n=1 Tax=Oncorhynchus tshawytscha TaxID=74940 RepID=A0AAZ3QYY2_ONCTS
MASRRVSSVPKSQKLTIGDSKSSKAVIENSKSNNSGTGNPSKAKGNSSGNGNKTKSGGTIVKSRYLQPVEKAPLTKNNSLTNESTLVPPRPASPKPVSVKPRVGSPARRSMAPQSLRNPTPMMSSVLEPSQLGRSILQSTILDGHCLRPDFDVSAIKDKTVLQNAAVEPERNDEHEKRLLEMQTFLLAYLTAKMENNSQKLKVEAEGRIIAVMEEEELLRKEVHEKKRQYLLLEKNKQLDDLLDLQITALTPVADAAKQFTQEYKSFAAAVDTTRHELPVKNFYIDGDRMTFLGVFQNYWSCHHWSVARRFRSNRPWKRSSLDCQEFRNSIAPNSEAALRTLCRMYSLKFRNKAQGVRYMTNIPSLRAVLMQCGVPGYSP